MLAHPLRISARSVSTPNFGFTKSTDSGQHISIFGSQETLPTLVRLCLCPAGRGCFAGDLTSALAAKFFFLHGAQWFPLPPLLKVVETTFIQLMPQ